MYVISYLRELYAAELPYRAIAVYSYLKDRMNKQRTCYPSIGTIAKELSMSRSTVQRAIQDLERTGFVTKEQRWRESGGRSSLLFTVK